MYSRNRMSIQVRINLTEIIGGRSYVYPHLFVSRHEKPADNALSYQNIQDRYHGRNDPVAKKILATHAETQGLAPPDDQSVVRFSSHSITCYSPHPLSRCHCIYLLFLSLRPSQSSVHESFKHSLRWIQRSSGPLFMSPSQGTKHPPTRLDHH